ncbi:benzoate-CoA ligase family [Amycolatopsis arida]|uniref:Benzoate-CoA ligase family n=1 Tax=Amycolatopsis arida TaxID=587909 RepID=A0A1I5P5G0_9PSEU|nr:benzoate-CoA ligase family protein [Amycolatopsis arida]TDX98359.1 benzoate-CoA ligase family protein [Amycolatopsis arida]SFP29050.1 benzoate-CoA ligase family [Amycolatopsis arida]
MNLTAYFLDRMVAEGRGDRTALYCVDSTGDATVSYAELAARAARIGDVLRGLGAGRGERVLLALSDGVDFVAAWYGAQRVGAVTAEVYTFLRPEDYAYFLGYTEARVVLVDVVTLDPVRRALADRPPGRRAVLLAAGVPEAELREGEHSLATLEAGAGDGAEPEPLTGDDVVIWKFTTGSTGAPKACVHPARSPVESYLRYARGVLDLRPDDVVLGVPKLFFGYARDLVAMFPFGVGAAGVVFAERSTPELLFDLIARYRPTILVNVPTMMSAMLASPRAATADLGCVRLCTSAGEALPAELHRRWDATFGVEVLDGIGSSEAYHIYLSNRPGAVRHGTVGVPVPGYTARVVDESGTEVPNGEIGVLEVTGPTVARGYHGAPEKSAATFRGDTLRTGDLFSRDTDGHFAHHGRADDLLKVGGVFVAPSEIEHCLVGHPDVLECAVVGVREAGLVRPWAYVVRRPGSTVDADELEAHVRERLAGHKRPRRFRFVDALPRTANGKLDRRALRERVEG